MGTKNLVIDAEEYRMLRNLLVEVEKVVALEERDELVALDFDGFNSGAGGEVSAYLADEAEPYFAEMRRLTQSLLARYPSAKEQG